MMKSVTTVENRKERRRSLGLRFFTLAAAACIAGVAAGGLQREATGRDQGRDRSGATIERCG